MILAAALGNLLADLLNLFLLTLLARIVLDYIMMFSRSWQPRGFMLAIVDVVFRITDPPLKLVRRFVPPLRIGQVALDMAFLLLYFGVNILISLVRPL